MTTSSRHFISIFLQLLLSGVVFLLLCFPLLLLAGPPESPLDPRGGSGETVPRGGSGDTSEFTPVTLNNPLNNIDSLEELIVALLNIFITLMIPVIVFFIIYAGFKYVVAQGNPGKIEEAHQTLLYVIIGGVLILAAVAIAEIIKNTVAAF